MHILIKAINHFACDILKITEYIQHALLDIIKRDYFTSWSDLIMVLKLWNLEEKKPSLILKFTIKKGNKG